MWKKVTKQGNPQIFFDAVKTEEEQQKKWKCHECQQLYKRRKSDVSFSISLSPFLVAFSKEFSKRSGEGEENMKNWL